MTSRKKAPITNYARHIYDEFFDKSRRLMNESGQDLSQFLSTFMPSDSETILMKPPDRLKKKKKEREVWCKERFREYYSEWIINNALLGHTKKYSKGLKGHKKGGKDRLIQKTLERIEREGKIIQKAQYFNVKELLAFAPTDRDGTRLWKKDIWELVADSIPEEKKKKAAGIKYVRELLESVKYNP